MRSDLGVVIAIDFDGPVSMWTFFGKRAALSGAANTHVGRFAVKCLTLVVSTESPIIDALTQQRIAVGGTMGKRDDIGIVGIRRLKLGRPNRLAAIV